MLITQRFVSCESIEIITEKNIAKHTQYTVPSWRDPKQRVMIHIYLLMVTIRWSKYIPKAPKWKKIC